MKKYNIEYYQLVLPEKEKQIKTLTEYQLKDYIIIGIEITESYIIDYLHINLDPQHDNISDSSVTSIEYAFTNRNNIIEVIKDFNDILIVFQKPDIDSIGTGSFLTLALNDKFEIFGDILLRLKAIANSDRHGRKDWTQQNGDLFKHQGFSSQGIPISLFTYIGDISISINEKVKVMLEYLETGCFNNGEYEIKALKQKQNSHSSTKVDILIRNKVVFVESTYRGAVGLGYTYAPVVIARNKQFTFGTDNAEKGTKYTIAQYNDSFINLKNILYQLNKFEPGWGGSTTIIGSRLLKPSEMDLSRIKQIVLANMKD